jgi:hypothetical protein
MIGFVASVDQIDDGWSDAYRSKENSSVEVGFLK